MTVKAGDAGPRSLVPRRRHLDALGDRRHPDADGKLVLD